MCREYRTNSPGDVEFDGPVNGGNQNFHLLHCCPPQNHIIWRIGLNDHDSRVSFLVRGASPIVISRVIFPIDQDFSTENPTKGTFESTLDALMDGFNFMKQCALAGIVLLSFFLFYSLVFGGLYYFFLNSLHKMGKLS
ncbi:hypothetical protein Tco_1517814 [Tanacetum coccineum]